MNIKAIPLDMDINQLKKNQKLIKMIDWLLLNVLDEDNIKFMKQSEIINTYNEYNQNLNQSNKMDAIQFQQILDDSNLQAKQLYESDRLYDDEEDIEFNYSIEEKDLKIQSKNKAKYINIWCKGFLFMIFEGNKNLPFKLYNDLTSDYYDVDDFIIYEEEIGYISKKELYNDKWINDNFDEQDYQQLTIVKIAQNLLKHIEKSKNKYFNF